MNKRIILLRVGPVFLAFAILFVNGSAYGQQDNQELNERVKKLEQYVGALQSTMVDYSDELNSSIEKYTQNLESSLESYAQKIQMNLDERLKHINRSVVILNRYSNAYQGIETNTGVFLISVERAEQLENGLRLYLNIGNPNFTDYQNFKLTFAWGRKWPGEHVISYADWRNSLHEAEFSFQGKIEKGKWNPAVVDLAPAGEGPLDYIECEMSVSSVELGYD